MYNLNFSVYSTQSLLNARGNPHLHNSLGTYCSKTLKSIVIIICSYLIKYYSHYCYVISNANYTDYVNMSKLCRVLMQNSMISTVWLLIT